MAVWTEQQLATFLTDVAQDDLYAAWWLAALRGLRRGELAGLRWTDVDLQTAELTVTQQRVHADGQVVAVPPKSAASCRVVALDAETVRVLMRHRERQEELSATAGARWRDSGYVAGRPCQRRSNPGSGTHSVIGPWSVGEKDAFA